MNRFIGLSPFEVVHAFKPRKLLDLILISLHPSVFVSTESFAQHQHDLHIEINKQLEASNALYKLRAYLHKRHVEFNVGDYVMIQIRSERRPSGPASNSLFGSDFSFPKN